VANPNNIKTFKRFLKSFATLPYHYALHIVLSPYSTTHYNDTLATHLSRTPKVIAKSYVLQRLRIISFGKHLAVNLTNNHSLPYYVHTIPVPPYDYKQQANNDSPPRKVLLKELEGKVSR